MKRILFLGFIIFLSTIASAQAIVELERAANNGDVQALMFVGKAYLNGEYGISVDKQKAYNFFLAAAEKGEPKAQYIVAKLYATYGEELSVDSVNMAGTLYWLKTSAENGYAPAQVDCGDILYEIAVYDLVLNFEGEKPSEVAKQMFSYYNKAAEQSYVPAYYKIATCYYQGLGCTKNIDYAQQYYNKAVDAGVNYGLRGIALCYAFRKDYNNAFIWYQKAIDAGISTAYNDIAYLYAEGKGVKRNFKKAQEMLDIAISKDPGNSNYYDSKGEIYLMEGNMEKAQEMWKQVLKLNPEAATSKTNLAKAMNNSVDNNIPTSESSSDKTFAVVIGNEEYQKVANVPFAANDAKVFGEYCQKTLGLPSNNVRYYSNATYANLLSAVDDIENISKAYNGDINVIFYYAGHGVPDEKTSKGYLLPTDADGRNMEVCYPLSRLYSELGSMGARTVVVFMDACFSGGQRGGGMLASARGVALKAKADKPKGNMVVFAAAKGDETAYPYTEQGHGLFTYYLLKILQETKGKATLKQLEEYVTTNVRQQSVVVNKKAQTPSVMSSVSNGSNWGDWKLR